GRGSRSRSAASASLHRWGSVASTAQQTARASADHDNRRMSHGGQRRRMKARCGMGTGGTQAHQVPLPPSPPQLPAPAPGRAMTKAYVESVARMAYVWGWPLVNSHNRRTAFAKAPEPGRNGGVLPVAPTGRIAMLCDYIKPEQNFVTCPNQDVV